MIIYIVAVCYRDSVIIMGDFNAQVGVNEIAKKMLLVFTEWEEKMRKEETW